MTERDAGTIGVHLRRIELQFLHDGARLGRKGFVCLDHVEIVDGEAGAPQRHARGRHGADTHVARIDAGMRVRHQSRQRRDTALFGGFARHQ